jgi:hypothetical protein
MDGPTEEMKPRPSRFNIRNVIHQLDSPRDRPGAFANTYWAVQSNESARVEMVYGLSVLAPLPVSSRVGLYGTIKRG